MLILFGFAGFGLSGIPGEYDRTIARVEINVFSGRKIRCWER